MDEQARARHRMEQELRHAMQRGDIKPFYQPIVEMETREFLGFEALARWRHAEMGEISPDRFIPIAEDCGAIAELTEQLLIQACEDALHWPDNILLSFNLSPALLNSPGLSELILSLLKGKDFPVDRLELEITESALVRDLNAARKCLGALREAGVKIALDDFGTGYSSLYHLRNFKVDRIKVDTSFVSAMTRDEDSAAIVKALVGLGSGLGLEVTAEGVETEEQRRLLIAQGCHQAQGFYFDRALSADDALKAIDSQRIATSVRVAGQ
jgi:EAL domain-containing protein (putative c-di-GMP-specific phosphodiesterase class I)